MKRFLIHIFAMTLLASCTKGFTSAERDIIYGGEEEIMRVLSIANKQDSLTLRSTSKPLKRDMVSQDEFTTLCRHGIRHNNDGTVAFCGSNHSQADTGVTGGWLDDNRIRGELAAFFCIFNHSFADAVLNGTCRV